jgi:MoaA/NifB/PqqE/SkfB family radical SAM enzyme
MFADDDASKRFIKAVAYVGAITTHYRTQHANFAEPTAAWPFPCTAGETTAVIDYNGDVRACELREKFATLHDYDFDFGALWATQERQAELNAIDGGRACWCTHVCFIHDSMRHSRRALLYEVPRNYLRRKNWQ